MKTLLLTLIILSTTSLNSATIEGVKPSYNKVYRTDRLGDSYYFLLLTKDGKYHHLFTNKTDSLSPSELKSSKLLEILKKKQSWGKAFPKKGTYTISKGKIYTKLLWNPIQILSPRKIKYLNKIFIIQ
ncbi:MAG: Unknown protein [uncultured Sulfurovum sp.]|uniref:Uncharacterized protein n=1 Tax=uncultured Sulfurovum sp. TaxID=269237 RepID=A0A6S6TWG2_9BACT|nr:MAG: Unknown protein [uncultured Sulfurovum sp.]